MAKMFIREVWEDENYNTSTDCNFVRVISDKGYKDLKDTISKVCKILESCFYEVDNPFRTEIFGDKYSVEYLGECVENNGLNLDLILDLLQESNHIKDWNYISFETFNTSNNDFE